MTGQVGSVPAAAGTLPRQGFRPELQALRAIAVVVVIGFHAAPGLVPGGFVGVDVFFVLSGFLMGSLLLREWQQTGRIRVGAFWARRARRLLPGALLLLTVTAVAVGTLAPLGLRGGWLREVAGSAWYVENWLLARHAVDYLHADDLASPLQHFWSLSVEEQFYIALPVAIAVVGLVAGADRRRRWRVLLAGLALVTTASFVLSVQQTRHGAGEAYFSTATRGWELLAGTALAAVALRPGVRVRRVLGWIGAAALAVALTAITSATPFPGTAALLPVVAALAAITAGDAGPVAWLARWRPVTWVGDISYALYLWHWPALALLPVVLARPLSPGERAGIVALCVLAAWASTRYVEDPIRFGRRQRRGSEPAAGGPQGVARPRPSGRRTALASGVAMAVVAGAALGGAAVAEERQHDLVQLAADVAASPALQRCLGANTLTGAAEGSDCPELDDLLVPDPAAADEDKFRIDDCWARRLETEARVCRAGVADGAVRVLVAGDSHTTMWHGAYLAAAREKGWKLDIAAHAGCSWSARPPAGEDADARACGAWRRSLSTWVARRPAYDLVITGASRSSELAHQRGDESVGEAAVASYREAWRPLIEAGSQVVVLADVPRMREDVIACVAKHRLAGGARCAMPRDDALAGLDAPVAAAAGLDHAHVLDLNELLCPEVRCPPVIGHVLAYQDTSHLSATFVTTLTGIFTRRLDSVLARASS